MFNKQKLKLQARKSAGTLRSLIIKNSNLIDFCSNDYLGFATGVKERNVAPSGSSGSRLLAGNYPLIESLEQQLSDFHDSEEALVFNSGYCANTGLFSSLPQKGDTIFYDELIHASVKDGMRLGFAKYFSFKHNDLHDLKSKIQRR